MPALSRITSGPAPVSSESVRARARDRICHHWLSDIPNGTGPVGDERGGVDQRFALGLVLGIVGQPVGRAEQLGQRLIAIVLGAVVELPAVAPSRAG